jgi:TolB-like protein
MRHHLCLLSLSSLALLVGCQPAFVVRAKPTKYFPYSWSEAELARAQGLSPVSTHNAQAKAAPSSAPAPMSASQEPLAPGELERVAVLELKNKLPQQISTDEISFLTNEARAVVSALPSSHFVVMTRESLEALIEPGKTLEDCVGTCEVETGRLLGAQWIITGEVVRFGSSLRVSLKLHNTRTGQLISGASLKGSKVEDLERPIKLETLRLTRAISPYLAQRLSDIAGDDLSRQLEALQMGKVR